MHADADSAAAPAAAAPALSTACHAANNAALLLSLALAGLSLLAPHGLAPPLAASYLLPASLLPLLPAPSPPPPAALATPAPLPGPPALHALLRGDTCAYLAVTPTTRLEFCPFERARLFTAREADWERFSSLSTATPYGSYSADASGQGARQAFEGGAPCAGGGQHSATIEFVCEDSAGPAGGGGAAGSPLHRLRLVSASDPAPCAHAFVLATSLQCSQAPEALAAAAAEQHIAAAAQQGAGGSSEPPSSGQQE